MLEFFNESTHRSRKERVCECCGKTIQVGETYTNQRGKYEGDFFARDLCLPCEAILDSFCRNVDNEFAWDEVAEYAQNCVCWSCQKYADDCCDAPTLQCPIVKRHFYEEAKA